MAVRRLIAVLVAGLILAGCGTPDTVIEDRRIRSGGNAEVIYEVRTDLYGWRKVTPVEYKRCQRGDVYPDCKGP